MVFENQVLKSVVFKDVSNICGGVWKSSIRNSMYIDIKKVICVSENPTSVLVTVFKNTKKIVRYIKTQFETVTVFEVISLL